MLIKYRLSLVLLIGIAFASGSCFFFICASIAVVRFFLPGSCTGSTSLKNIVSSTIRDIYVQRCTLHMYAHNFFFQRHYDEKQHCVVFQISLKVVSENKKRNQICGCKGSQYVNRMCT